MGVGCGVGGWGFSGVRGHPLLRSFNFSSFFARADTSRDSTLFCRMALLRFTFQFRGTQQDQLRVIPKEHVLIISRCLLRFAVASHGTMPRYGAPGPLLVVSNPQNQHDPQHDPPTLHRDQLARWS